MAHLRDGRIVSHGTHTDLLAQDPRYRSLVARDTDISDDSDDDSLEEVKV